MLVQWYCTYSRSSWVDGVESKYLKKNMVWGGGMPLWDMNPKFGTWNKSNGSMIPGRHFGSTVVIHPKHFQSCLIYPPLYPHLLISIPSSIPPLSILFFYFLYRTTPIHSRDLLPHVLSLPHALTSASHSAPTTSPPSCAPSTTAPLQAATLF